VENARAQWKAAKADGATVTYWQQTNAGRWEKKA
jgi:DNA polymerase-3 subunit chi